MNFGTPDFAFKISGTHREQKEGYLTNLVTGEDLGREEYTQITINSLFKISENLEVEITLTDEQQDQDAHTSLNLGGATTWWCAVYGQCSPGIGIPQSGDRYKVYNNEPNARNASFESFTGILEVRWDLSDNYKLDYILGRKTTDEEVDQDWDGTPLTLYHTTRDAEYEQLSHELRLTSDLDGSFNYVVGLYKWDSEYTIPMESRIGFFDLFGAVPTQDPLIVVPLYNYTHQETDSMAVFFEGDYDINDQFTLTIGGRYIDEEKSSNACQGPGPYPDCSQINTYADKTFTKFTPKVALSYQSSENMLYYISYSQGYRSGGFNGRWGNQFSAIRPYRPETVTNIELGLKSDYLDGRLRLNAALFRADIENLQTTIFDTSIVNLFFSDNAANATINGFEADFIWLPESIDGLTVTGAISRLNTEITEVLTPTDDVQKSDQLAFAPEMQGNLRARYEWDLNSGITAYVMPSFIWSSEAFSDVITINRIEMNSYTMANISAGLLSELWSSELYVNNLTDRRAQVSNNFVFDVQRVTYAQPRTFGLRLKYNF